MVWIYDKIMQISSLEPLSNDRPPELLEVGEKLVLAGLADGEPLRGRFLEAAGDEVLGVLGDGQPGGEVDLLLDLRGAGGTILARSASWRTSKGMLP